MNFCQNCGESINATTRFCQVCGSQVNSSEVYNQSRINVVEEKNDDNSSTIVSVFAYIIFFVPLIAGTYKTSEFVKFHTNQGIILFILGIAVGVIHTIISILLSFVSFYGWMFFRIADLLWLIFPLLSIYGIMNVVNGKMRELPIIGNFKILK